MVTMQHVGLTLVAILKAGSAWQPSLHVQSNALLKVSSQHHQHRSSPSLGATEWGDGNEGAASNNEWSIADDWDALSSENPVNAVMDSSDVFNQDIVQNAAQSMRLHEDDERDEQDMWLDGVIEDIIQQPVSSTPLYDTGFSEQSARARDTTNLTPEQQQKEFEELMGAEISKLVRCNESPEDMLVSQGRAVSELTTEQKMDVTQLLVWRKTKGEWKLTTFFQKALANMFQQHASVAATTTSTNTDDKTDKAPTMDAKAISRWMTQSVGTELDSYTTRGRTGNDMTSGRQKQVVKIGPHDSRVLKVLSKYSNYGTGQLTLENFQQVYLDALTTLPNGLPVAKKGSSVVGDLQVLQLRNFDHVRQVWRDLKNHGIVGPNEQEWNEKRAAVQAQHGSVLQQQQHLHQQDFVDECEILDLAYEAPPTEQQLQEGHDEKNHKYIRKSSYEGVQLAPDGKTPLYMEEGDFVFIDEESCIGCMQCVTAAPASYLLLENGRARTWEQRKGPDVRQGVAACPVNCMHLVSYDELKELETVRDKGDGRDDHRHMGHRRGHTPLHVAGIDSDNNHRSSWYHYIKNKCCTSGQCPQRGCFDCPSYRASGENPFFKKKAKEAQHVRAQHFLDRGDVDLWRKTAEL